MIRHNIKNIKIHIPKPRAGGSIPLGCTKKTLVKSMFTGVLIFDEISINDG